LIQDQTTAIAGRRLQVTWYAEGAFIAQRPRTGAACGAGKCG
jgi:hypothetical protein